MTNPPPTTYTLTEAQLARIQARRGIERKHLLLVVLFLRGHPEQSVVRALYDFVRGRGPAAVAAGRVAAPQTR